MVRRGHRRSGKPFEIILFPFLDIVFSMIGIFILIFSFQTIMKIQKPRREKIDQVVTCINDDRFSLYADREKQPAQYESDQIDELLAILFQSQSVKIINLIFAFDASCVKNRRRFLAKFRDRVMIEKGSPRSDEDVVVRLAQWPLQSESDAEKQFIRRWKTGDKSNGSTQL